MTLRDRRSCIVSSWGLHVCLILEAVRVERAYVLWHPRYWPESCFFEAMNETILLGGSRYTYGWLWTRHIVSRMADVFERRTIAKDVGGI